MGEIADGLINGDFDAETGEYLGEGYGFPRVQRGGKIVSQHQGAIHRNPMAGIANYLGNKGVSKKMRRELMLEFTGGKPTDSNKKLAEIITEDFGNFLGFVKRKLKNH